MPTRVGYERADSWESPLRGQFWRWYVVLGFAVLALQSGAALGFYALAKSVTHRGVLVALTSSSGGVALAGLAVSVVAAASRWRLGLAFAISSLSGVVVLVCCLVDRGSQSPLVYLLVVPVAYVAVAMPRPLVLVSGLLAALELMVVFVARHGISRGDPALLVQIAFLIGVGAISIVAAIARGRLDSEEERLRHELERLANTDSLTGCLNRRGFADRLEVEVARSARTGSAMSLLMMDLDRFKHYNDRSGHLAGDAALAAVGRILLLGCRRTDVVGRVGGDEFAMILPVTDITTAVFVAERLGRDIDECEEIELTMSIGVAQLDPADPSAGRLLHDADVALYRGKAAGRHRVVAADPLPERA